MAVIESEADTFDGEFAEGKRRNPARIWQIAAALLAVIALALAVVLITGADDEVKASPPVTSDQEADLDEIAFSDANSDAKLEAKRAQIETLTNKGADLATAGNELKTANAALQTDLDEATKRASEAEADATAAVAEAQRSADTAAEATAQVDALATQIENLNREIGSLTSEADRLADQNAALQKANDDLAAQNDAVTAQLTALDGVQQQTYQCARGLVEAVRQRDDPDWWDANGEATTATCTDAQAALDAYNAQFGG